MASINFPLEIPKDVWQSHIFPEFNFLTLWRFKQVCRSWHKLVLTDVVWRNFFEKNFTLNQRLAKTSWMQNCKFLRYQDFFNMGVFHSHFFKSKNARASDKENYLSFLGPLSIEIWNYETNQRLAYLNLEKTIKKLPKNSIENTFLKNTFVIFSIGGCIGVWNWKTKKKPLLVDAYKTEIRFLSVHEDKIATLAANKIVKIWQLNTKNSLVLKQLSSLSFKKESPLQVALDGDFVAISFKNPRTSVYNWRNKDLSPSNTFFRSKIKKLFLQGDLVVACLDQEVVFCNWRSARMVRTISENYFSDIALKGEILVFHSPKKWKQSKSFEIWNWRTSQRLHCIFGELKRCHPSIFIQDNHIRIFGSKKIQVLTFV